MHNRGEPMPADEQSHIFERFVRLNGGDNGWGIGLALVRGLTDALGGQLGLDSRHGEGTTFSVSLPRDSRPYQRD